MKGVIEKAIENGYVPPLTDKRMKYHSYSLQASGEGIYVNYGTGKRGKLDSYRTWYELIFGTPLVDKLAGEGLICSFCGSDGFGTLELMSCPRGCSANFINKGNFHRREMANIKDIDKLKDYIRTLT